MKDALSRKEETMEEGPKVEINQELGIQEINKTKKKKIVFGVIIVLIAVLGIGTYLLNTNDFQFDNNAENGTIDGLSEDEIQKMMQDKADKSLFLISMNTMPEFKDGKSKGTLKIENDPRNNYVMKVEIRIDEGNELIYTSEGIKPGQVIKKDTLDKALKKGKYKCTATFIAFDKKEDYKEVGKAAAQIELYVNN